MTVRSTRVPLLILVVASTSTAAPALSAQQSEAAARRAARAESTDPTIRQLRRLQARADSLARLFNEAADPDERRRTGVELDATVDQIEPLLRRLTTMESRSGIELRLQTTPMAQMFARMRRATPRGWLGIVVSGVARESAIDNGEMTVRYLTYPEIVSVEPNSPAERAGLEPGDTLVAYDRHDLRDTDISFAELRPGSRAIVRVRRDGRIRDIPVTIANVPSRITVRRKESLAEGFSPASGEQLFTVPAFPRAPIAPNAYSVRAPATPRAPAVTVMTVPPIPPGTIVLNFNGVAGAELSSLSDTWARTLGAKQGVLVTRAPASSLAAQSGLQDADVIVKVSGQPVISVGQVRELVAAAAEAGEHSVELEIVRARRPMRLALRW